MSEGVWIAIIANAVVLIGYILTFVVQMKKLRAEQRNRDVDFKAETQKSISALKNSVDATLSQNRQEYMSGISDVKTQIAVIDTKIQELSNRVEKHNSIVERTYKLEADVAVLKNEVNDGK